MWLDPLTLTVYRSPAQIRAAFPAVSFPREMSAVAVADCGLVAVAPVAAPVYDPVYQVVEEQPPAPVEGVWTQQWAVRDFAPAELAASRAALHAQRRARRTQAETGGFTFQDRRIDSDKDSILRITQAALLASQSLLMGQPFAVSWVCADDSVLALDAAGMLALQAALTLHGLACHNRSQAVRDLLAAAPDGPALAAAAAELNAGWPGDA